MCGIVGLFLKDPALEPQLGAMLNAMLGTMCERGPDSAGFAIYGSPVDDRLKLTVRARAGTLDAARLATEIERETGVRVRATTHDTHLVLTIPADSEATVRDALFRRRDMLTLISTGHVLELFKEVGRPDEVARRFKLADMSGTHGIAHTRMATESAVSTNGAHPFSTGTDQCLVHNGSLSNHNALRRRLAHAGLDFETDNDSEVAAAYLTWRMREGASLDAALASALDDLDGFFTFVVGTRDGFGVLRDPIACKPAVLAETDDYVAFGSEYRALAPLEGIGKARVWEPEPAIVYAWTRG